MDLITRNEIREMCAERSDGCASIYFATQKAGHQKEVDLIKYRNLLKTAEAKLRDAGDPPISVQRMLERAVQLQHDGLFWRSLSDGLAVFLAADRLRAFRLPIAFQDDVRVGHRFHITPLLPMLHYNGRLYVLAVSQNEVRLFHATRQEVDEVPVPDLPKNLEAALDLEDKMHDVMYHAGGPGHGASHGGTAALYHGHDDTDKTRPILQYFQQIDTALRPVLRDEHVPLVFAGVDYLFPLYQQANSYRHLADDFIRGNPKLLSRQELSRRAWEAVEPRLQQDRMDAVAAYYERGLSGASRDLKEVLEALAQRRVETLFLERGATLWGTFNPVTSEIHVDEGPTEGNEDLVGCAAVKALQQDADVYLLKPGDVPGGGPIAATFRYALQPQMAGR